MLSPYLQMLLAGPGHQLCPAGPGAQLHRADPLSKLEGVECLAGILLHRGHLENTRAHSPPKPATPTEVEGVACSPGTHGQGSLAKVKELVRCTGCTWPGLLRRLAGCLSNSGAREDKGPFPAQLGYLGEGSLVLVLASSIHTEGHCLAHLRRSPVPP